MIYIIYQSYNMCCLFVLNLSYFIDYFYNNFFSFLHETCSLYYINISILNNIKLNKK